MAPRGRRTSLAELAGDVGDNSPVDRPPATDARPSSVALTDLTANPRNPRADVGDLANLASIAEMQLQPAVVVTAGAYRALYPDDAIETRYVVINGCRRLAAAHKYGRTHLDIVVNDALARDRITLVAAAITENVDREDFDVIEEARAVEALITECGRAFLAAERLHRTEGWVSQRRALLKLDPQLQTALRRGELAIREARALAQVPREHQVARWRAALAKQQDSGGADVPAPTPTPSKARTLTTALAQFDRQPDLLVNALRNYLGDAGLNQLGQLLQAGATRPAPS